MNIVWFRRDLRIHDHPALLAAFGAAQPALACYVLPPQDQIGAAQKPWLHQSLLSLQSQLQTLNLELIVIRHLQDMAEMINDIKPISVFTQASQTPWEKQEVMNLKALLSDPSKLSECGQPWLVPPHLLNSGNGGVYKVFTPFANAVLRQWKPSPPAGSPPPFAVNNISSFVRQVIEKYHLTNDKYGLLTHKSWEKSILKDWLPGDVGARQRWGCFKQNVAGYAQKRNDPYLDATSLMSPHLVWGEISIHELAWDAYHLGQQQHPEDWKIFIMELVWREFARYLWQHDPMFIQKDWRSLSVPWVTASWQEMRQWKKGETGIPMVDAGMRQLWSTGWMHNRVRMVVADWWCKHGGHDWRLGAAWFWETLLDADPANNALGWQWAGGTGPDAAPYYRLFNPTRQAERFDPQGVYRQKWIKELKGLGLKEILEPWKSPTVMAQKKYPLPLLTPDQSRKIALARYKN